MPSYEIQSSSGKSYKYDFERQPTLEDFEELRAHLDEQEKPSVMVFPLWGLLAVAVAVMVFKFVKRRSKGGSIIRKPILTEHQRIFYYIALTLGPTGAAVYTTVQRNDLDYRTHPVGAILGSTLPAVLVGGILFWASGRWGWHRASPEFAVLTEGTSPSEADPSGTVDDLRAYAAVAKELANGTRSEGLWLKCFTEANGDEAKTKVAYTKLRVAALKVQPEDSAASLDGKTKI